MAEPLDAREVTLGDTTFQIRKLLPMELFKLFEVLRPAIQDALTGFRAGSFAALAGENDTARISICVALVASVPADIVDAARRTLFKHVFYQGEGMPNPQPLEGQENTAFKNLEPVHVYEVLVRCLYINFIESWGVLKSLFPQLQELIPQSEPETSTPSSPTP